MAFNCRTYCSGCNSCCGRRRRRSSKFECEFGKSRIVGPIKFWNRIFQAGWRRRRTEKSLVKERNFRGDRKTGRRRSSHIIAVNMHDIEVTLDFLDEGTELLRKDIDVME